ncbi:hypothetical protein [Saccharopolyspora mangrovi]|uniref:Uncharacterized protein n=1 Tax=Saccharopolyspora mangrovi TaxID=3082379 RepID=A0ABU6A9X5_9PSEU|nr:hypothetical protein [Saccharopolyspora sp. S2-29]MEB3368349.1 hypothetical protein [Saccharopolyspora sp. S2-29]
MRDWLTRHKQVLVPVASALALGAANLIVPVLPAWAKWALAGALAVALAVNAIRKREQLQAWFDPASATTLHGPRQPLPPAVFYPVIALFLCGVIISNIVWTLWARARRRAGHRWLDILLWRQPEDR